MESPETRDTPNLNDHSTAQGSLQLPSINILKNQLRKDQEKTDDYDPLKKKHVTRINKIAAQKVRDTNHDLVFAMVKRTGKLSEEEFTLFKLLYTKGGKPPRKLQEFKDRLGISNIEVENVYDQANEEDKFKVGARERALAIKARKIRAAEISKLIENDPELSPKEKAEFFAIKKTPYSKRTGIPRKRFKELRNKLIKLPDNQHAQDTAMNEDLFNPLPERAPLKFSDYVEPSGIFDQQPQLGDNHSYYELLNSNTRYEHDCNNFTHEYMTTTTEVPIFSTSSHLPPETAGSLRYQPQPPSDYLPNQEEKW